MKIRDIYNLKDTIAAVSTSPGAGAIGIVRLSGKNALKIADKIFAAKNKKKPSKVSSHTIHYGWIVDKTAKSKSKNPKTIDEVLLTVMRAPGTYTRQDMIEINCHGGVLAVKKTLELVLGSGARLAEPGEFTKRAFLNGRIDLARAEAVLDVINAKTGAGLSVALGQLNGKLSKVVNELKQSLVDILANLEACLDFSQENIEVSGKKEIISRLESLRKQIARLVENAGAGCILRDGIMSVICGKPNVGKSSLMNAFLREDKVIVTPIAGTTRDAIEDIINIKGIPLKVVDTAGIIEPKDLVEKEGIARSQKYLNQADLILFVLDNSRPLSGEDFQVMDKIKDKPVIVIVNKIDLPGKLDFAKIAGFLKGKRKVKICAVKEKGIPALEEAVKSYVLGGKAVVNREGVMVSNLRHKRLLEQSLEFIGRAGENLNTGIGEELVAEDIKSALNSMAGIIGEITPDDILNKIFEDFCIGK